MLENQLTRGTAVAEKNAYRSAINLDDLLTDFYYANGTTKLLNSLLECTICHNIVNGILQNEIA